MSIVIPCWNAEGTVCDAIESALCQDYERTEVIVVNDGSTDSSALEIAKFKGRVKTLNVENGGSCRARNVGVRLANGSLIQFLDADDILFPEKVGRQVEVMSEGAIPYCFGLVEPADDFLVHKYRRPQRDDSVCFVLDGPLQTSAPLHQRKFLVAIGGFDERLPCAQERDLHIRLACLGLKFVLTPFNGFVVRRQETSLSSDPVRVLLQHELIVERAIHLLEEKKQLTAARRYYLARMLSHGVRALVREGHEDIARKRLKRAVKVSRAGALSPWSPMARILARFFDPITVAKLSLKYRSA